MNWNLIPDIFFDVIARIVPGSLFLLGAFVVHFGPKTFAKEVIVALHSANFAFVGLFGLFAYFVAIVLKEIWGFCALIISGMDRSVNPSDPFLSIRIQMPEETSRLLKLQAEKNICEVLIPGLVILFLGNFWMGAIAPGELMERVFLGVILLISGVAFWSWRKMLDILYDQGLKTLQSLLEKENSNDKLTTATKKKAEIKKTDKKK